MVRHAWLETGQIIDSEDVLCSSKLLMYEHRKDIVTISF